MLSTIEVRTYVLPAEATGEAVPTVMRYDPADPYAVTFVFHDDDPVTWRFGRYLLAAGLRASAGLGDVKVRPHNSDFVTVELSNEDDTCTGYLPRTAAVAFLNRSYKVVPRGRESHHLDVDAALELLTSGGN